MRIDSLEAYDVAPDILSIWREEIGTTLLPVQEKAVKAYDLFGDGNLIVFSPTSSGKTFVGEMAAVKAARQNTKVFYLVPQKALAEEKYRSLSRRYARAGIEVVISSRDHREHDAAIAGRRFQIAVVVFEKLQALLIAQPNLVQAVGLVVVDELQMITDPERGPDLELLLTKLKVASNRPRIIGLSAVLGQADRLAAWLDARLLIDQTRPVQLRKGVLCGADGVFRYREHNGGGAGSEEIAIPPSKDHEELMVAAADTLTRRGEQVLMFVPDRARAVALARRLAARVSHPVARAAVCRLREGEETFGRESLLTTLDSGIAFHHADLTLEEREAIEDGFRAGEIRALVSTSTLAIGMNLPAKNVILDGRRWKLLREYGRWSLEDLSKSEYENMSGRAGRLALTRDFGRSILVTSSAFEADAWMRCLIDRAFEDAAPTLGDAPLEDHILDLVASGAARSGAQIAELLSESFTGFVHWKKQLSSEAFAAQVRARGELCVEAGLIRARRGGALEITLLGKTAAARRIGVATARAFAGWAAQARGEPVCDLEAAMVLSLSRAGADIYVSLGFQERRRTDHRDQVLARARALGAQDRPLFRRFADDRWAAELDEAKACKKTAFLMDWIDELPTRDIEERYSVWAGAVRRVADEYGWLAQALAEVCRASRWPAAAVGAIVELGDRLVHGVRADALPLLRTIGRGEIRPLARTVAGRLRARGLLDPEALREAGADAAREAFGRRGVFESFWARLVPPSQPAAAPATVQSEVAGGGEPDAELAEHDRPEADIDRSLVIELRRRRVTFGGVDIPTAPPNHLQRQAFGVLAVLARHAGHPVSEAEIAGELQAMGFTLKRSVLSDLRDLRYKILRPFRLRLRGLPTGAEIDRLVATIPGGLRLDAPGAVIVR
jgi:helicase